ncbi:MAG: Spy/CpxP family protein refolding chaperone [Myxococcota bacterium]|nr:Spy/CpxP family protein refolding chaperone [Myxococcota bacterium]
MSRTVLAAGFAVLGAFSMVTFSAVASPDAPAVQLESVEADAAGQGRPEDGRARKGGKRGKSLMSAVQELDLTDAQRSQLDVLKAEQRAERVGKPNRASQHGAPEDLLGGAQDRAAAHAALDARYSDRLARAHSKLDRTMDLLDILTPEQQLALRAELRADRAR